MKTQNDAASRPRNLLKRYRQMQGVLNVAGVICVLLAWGLAGCGTHRRPLPEAFVETAQPVGIPNVRAWGGRYSPLFQKDFIKSIRQVQSYSPHGLVDESGYVNILALSGGGPDGAFGAGMLAGGTEHGTRPTFKLVTGVSTGALIAPFAFLGPKHDATLRKFYTTIETKDVVTPKPLLLALAEDDSLADTTPLARLIKQTITPEVLDEIAAAHRQGRRLYICTTNLDARRAVIWNMGAIAASGKPNALEMFRNVMRASASIPVAMGPVYVPVYADGKIYDELHVDGGVTTEVFFYGFMLDLPAAVRAVGITQRPKVRIFIVRNSQITAHYQQVEPRIMPIASRAISSLIATQAVGDLYRIYTITRRDGIEFNLAHIPSDFKPAATESFDPAEMKRLYNLGYSLAAKGYPWEKTPPGLDRSQIESFFPAPKTNTP